MTLCLTPVLSHEKLSIHESWIGFLTALCQSDSYDQNRLAKMAALFRAMWFLCHRPGPGVVMGVL